MLCRVYCTRTRTRTVPGICRAWPCWPQYSRETTETYAHVNRELKLKKDTLAKNGIVNARRIVAAEPHLERKGSSLTSKGRSVFSKSLKGTKSRRAGDPPDLLAIVKSSDLIGAAGLDDGTFRMIDCGLAP